VVYQDDRDNGIIGDWAGQLEERREYWMGRRMSGLI
jgi:hypothetical protein